MTITVSRGDVRPFHNVVSVTRGISHFAPDQAGAILLSESGEALLRGPQSRFAPSPAASLTIRLTPLAWISAVGMAAGDMADRVAPLPLPLARTTPDVLRFLLRINDSAERLSAAEAWLCHHAQPFDLDLVALEGEIARHIADPDMMSVGQICAATGLTQPRLSRLTLKLFGFRPKLLLRRARFLRTLATMNDQPDAQWCQCLDPSYVDQSHFIRDCHAFLGMTPTCYMALASDRIAA